MFAETGDPYADMIRPLYRKLRRAAEANAGDAAALAEYDATYLGWQDDETRREAHAFLSRWEDEHDARRDQAR